MKLVITGGGSGGHFYPLIAVVDEVRKKVRAEHQVEAEIFYLANVPYNTDMLHQYDIKFKKITAGKSRIYKSKKNLLTPWLMFVGLMQAIWWMVWNFPDAVFSKGGYPSVPVTMAANLFGIPIIVHESDAYPGRANQLAGKHARKIGISFPECKEYFDSIGRGDRVALVGTPVRADVQTPQAEGSHEYFQLTDSVPTIWVTGGSHGAKKINDTLLTVLPDLVEKYNIIHQTGTNDFDDVQKVSSYLLEKSAFAHRYKLMEKYTREEARRLAGISDLVVMRAGSNSIFETALWGIPSIVIPITKTNGDHQRKNAYAYARTGACEVIEEDNFTPHILAFEIDKILGDGEHYARMKAAAKSFAKPDAAEKIADLIIDIGIKHNK